MRIAGRGTGPNGNEIVFEPHKGGFGNLVAAHMCGGFVSVRPDRGPRLAQAELIRITRHFEALPAIPKSLGRISAAGIQGVGHGKREAVAHVGE